MKHVVFLLPVVFLLMPVAHAQDIAAYQKLINQYCVGCHSEAAKTGGIVLEKRDLTQVPADAAVWERVVRKVRAGEMPPQGMPRPAKADLDGLTNYLANTLDQAAAGHPDPGRTLIHRLNRTEYSNAIHDLFTLDVDVSELLPPDDSVEGFDNIAQMLTVSPVLLEQYLAASAEITKLAVGDPAIGVEVATYRPAADLSQTSHIEGLPIGTVGGILIKHNFPLDAEYVFEPKISRQILGVPHGVENVHALEVTLDGVRVKLAHFGGSEEDTRAHIEPFATSDAIDARFAFRLRVSAGPHTIGAAFLRRPAAQTAEAWQQFQRTTIDNNETKGEPHLAKLIVRGPYSAAGPGTTPSRRQVFVCTPQSAKDEIPCARKILTAVATRAYRRPLNDTDVERLLTFYQRGRNNSTFDRGIEVALRRVISGPEFVYRAEQDPPNVAVGAPYRISDIELASRLSFFLWSTIPDKELYGLAVQGRLGDPQTLESQVRRMLADPKAEALVDNFAAEWLQLRTLRGVQPDPDVFPDFDDNLRQAMIRETELLFESVMKEDRSVSDLLTADYTFVNERLARHYGIPEIYGDRFRRIQVTDEARKGLIGQASFLTLTSVATRTSPVARGKWILTNILGTPPPAPPPNVPPLKDVAAGEAVTMRDRMAAHRASPVCATCHKVMDPIGFSLENFDGVGRWRDKEGDAPIDAADTLFDGAKVNGATGLRQFLLSRPDVFVETMTEKMMTYALGRGLDYRDMPAVRKIIRDAAPKDYRFSSMVLGIVQSPEFQMRTKQTPLTENASANAPADSPRRPQL